MAVPRATYRVQLHAQFDLDAGAEIADYLAALGASHLYTSPLLQAARGSTHGYDVVDHAQVSRELGGVEALRRLAQALARHGLGHVLDVVPNHMAVGRDNAWWWDVLENGPSSRFAAFFDVDWDPPEARLRNLVLVPVLAESYGRVLEAGELRLERQGGRFSVRYREHELPVAPVRSTTCYAGRRLAAARRSSPSWPTPSARSHSRPPPTTRASRAGTGTRRCCGARWPVCSRRAPMSRPRWTPSWPGATRIPTSCTRCSSVRRWNCIDSLRPFVKATTRVRIAHGGLWAPSPT